jgi:WD40 repeat protein
MLGWGRLRALLAALLVVGLTGLGGGLLWSRPGQGDGDKGGGERAAAVPGKDRHGDPLPKGAVARLGTVRFRHPTSQLVGIAAADSKTLVSVGWDNRVCFWEVETGKLIRRFGAGDFHVRSFALSQDGKRIALGGYLLPEVEGRRPAGLIRVFDAATGKEVRTFARKDERMDPGCLAFSPDGKVLASLGEQDVVRLEEVATGAELLRHKFPRGVTRALAFSPDGKLLAVATSGHDLGKVHLWDWRSGQAPREVRVPPGGALSLAFSPDGKTLATGDYNEEGVRLWEVATGRLLRTLADDGDLGMNRVCFSPDGRYLAGTSHAQRALIVWDAKTGQEVRRHGYGGGLLGWPVFTPDSRRLAAGMGDGVLRVWDVATGEDRTPAEAHRYPPSFVALLAGGTAVTAGDDGSVRFWDSATGRQRRALTAAEGWVRAAALSSDGRWLATSEMGFDHAVNLWDAATGRRVYHLPGHGQVGGHRAVAFTPDGRQFLSWGDDMYLRRWEVRNGKAVAEHPVRIDGKALADYRTGKWSKVEIDNGRFSPDGSRLVIAFYRTLYVFDTATAGQTAKFAQREGSISGLAIFPNAKHLLVSTWGRPQEVKLNDGRTRQTVGAPVVCLYDLAAGKQVWRREVGEPGKPISKVAISRDGKTYAVGVGSSPARIELGELATGKVRGVIEGVPAGVRALAFSPDGRRLIAGLADTTAVVWDLAAAVKR